ncbi:SIR2 family protein [Methylophilus luteus]|uniref:SIR2 family protein n=1 Tax=Methylophilus luteus TaxID=640108 RepID=A0ABW3FAA5_9PROT
MKIIQSRAFAVSFALNPHRYSWLLGAGTSASAGIPTGYMMIREFKTELFCIENNIPRKQVDALDQLWVDRIDQYFKKRNTLPQNGDPSEYSAAFEALYPSESDRRAFIEKAIKLGTPSFGHRILGAFLASKSIQTIFTTNFDSLIESATERAKELLPPNDRHMLTVSAIDSTERAERCLKESSWPLLVKLHGDYQSTQIKNTASELAQQDQRLLEVFKTTLEMHGLIVVGYSGRDHSIMNALSSVLESKSHFPNGIYWVAKSEKSLIPQTLELLQQAEKKGVETNLVIAENFDEFLSDLAQKTKLSEVLNNYIFESIAKEKITPTPISYKEALKFPVLKCSGVPLDSIPKQARHILLNKTANIKEIREKLREANVYAVIAIVEKGLAAFGQDEGLLKALADYEPTLGGYIALDPLNHSWAKGLIYDALLGAICRGKPLKSILRNTGHSIVVSKPKPEMTQDYAQYRNARLNLLRVAYQHELTGHESKLNFEFSEGIKIKLEHYLDKWWCVIEPFTQVTLPEELEIDPSLDWRRERWVTKYNGQWSSIIDAWANLIGNNSSDTITSYGISPEVGIDAQFTISSVTGWSRPSHTHSYFNRKS